MKRLFLLLYLVAVSGLLLSTILDERLLHVVTKASAIPLLILYYLSAVDGPDRSLVVVLALMCSYAGDVFLLDDTYFMHGLVSFLIAHIVYVVAYRHHRNDQSTDSISGLHRVRLAFPVVLAGSGLVVILYPTLGALRIPVIIYAGVICTMVLVSLFRYGRTSNASFWMVFSGAVLFMVSDSILAINKFLAPFEGAGFQTLLTYTGAQFLIVEGLLRHPRQPD